MTPKYDHWMKLLRDFYGPFHGDVEWGYAALVGLPASVGAVAGTAIQQRLATRSLALAFAALLVVVGVLLLTT